MAKTDEFDPYRTWLGIPPEEQPPTHYRLLGISESEDDGEVISNAADRQMAHVRTFQSGARSVLSQEILNELAAARVCLLDPKQKSAYDAKLKKRRAAAKPPPAAPASSKGPPPPTPVRVAAVSTDAGAADVPQGQPVPVGTAADSSPAIPHFSSRPTVSSTRRRARRKTSPVPIVVGVIAFAALVGVLIYVAGSGGRPPKPGTGGTTGGKSGGSRSTDSARSGTTSTRDDRPRRDKGERRTDGGRREGGPRGRRSGENGGRSDDRPADEPGGNGPEYDFATAAAVNDMLSQARASLEAGDLAAARGQLDEAAGKAPPGAPPARIATLRTVADHLEKFHSGLFAGLRGLPADTSIDTLGGKATVHRVEPGDPPQVTFSFDGERRTRPATQLPPRVAVAIARRVLPDDDARSKLYAAVYVTLRRGDEPIAGPLRQLWRDIREDELASADLLAELDAPKAGKRDDPDEPDVPDEPPPGDTAGPPPGDDRVAPPEGEALREATRWLNATYRAEFAKARQTEEKAALAQKLYLASRDSDDAAREYALLARARDLAVEIVNTNAFLPMIDDMADRFQVDRLKEKLVYLVKTSREAQSEEQNSELFLAAKDLFDEARDAGRYDVAEGLARLASNTARKAKKWQSMAAAEKELKKMEAFNGLLAGVDEARQTLSESPDDPQANLRVGRALCLVEQQWVDGCRHLAKGSDAELAALAEAELAQPADSGARRALGENWLALARRKSDPLKPVRLERARHWLTLARDELSGDGRAEVDQLLATIAEQLDDSPAGEK